MTQSIVRRKADVRRENVEERNDAVRSNLGHATLSLCVCVRHWTHALPMCAFVCWKHTNTHEHASGLLFCRIEVDCSLLYERALCARSRTSILYDCISNHVQSSSDISNVHSHKVQLGQNSAYERPLDNANPSSGPRVSYNECSLTSFPLKRP